MRAVESLVLLEKPQVICQNCIIYAYNTGISRVSDAYQLPFLCAAK
jgi:hypothetical protein